VISLDYARWWLEQCRLKAEIAEHNLHLARLEVLRCEDEDAKCAHFSLPSGLTSAAHGMRSSA
jgi:hypothetical protein